MATLRELTSELLSLKEAFDDPEFDIESLEGMLDAVLSDFADKADGYGTFINEIETEIYQLKKESDRLLAEAKLRQAKVDDLKDRLKEAMEQTGNTKFSGMFYKFSVVKNGGKAPLKTLCEPNEMPPEYQKLTISADSEKIRKALEDGEQLDFAFLGERGTHLSIR